MTNAMQSEGLRSVSRRASEAPISPITRPPLIGLCLFMSWPHMATWHLFISRHWRPCRRYIRQALFQTTQGDSWRAASCRSKALTSACPPQPAPPGAGVSAWLPSSAVADLAAIRTAGGKSAAVAGPVGGVGAGGGWRGWAGAEGHHKVSPETRN